MSNSKKLPFTQNTIPFTQNACILVKHLVLYLKPTCMFVANKNHMKKTSLLGLTTFTLFTAVTSMAQNPVQTTSGASTSNYLSVFNAVSGNPSTIKNSVLYDNGTSVILGNIYTIGGELFSVQKQQNALTNAVISNTNNTSLAGSGYSAIANGPSLQMQAFATGGTGAGMFAGGAVALSALGAINSMNIGIASTSTAPLNFWTNGLQQMTLNNSGQLIVGAAAPLNAELFSVQKSQNAPTFMRVTNATSGTEAYASYAATASITTGYVSASLTALSGGYTSSGPSQAGTAALTSTGILNIGTNTSNPINFWTNNAQHMTLLSSGNLGIGNTSPAYPLDVNGNIHVPSGSFFFSGTMTATPTYLQSGYSSGFGHSMISSFGTALFINYLNSQDVVINSGTGNTGRVLIGNQKQSSPADAAHVAAILQVNGDMVVGTSGTGAHANIWVTESNWADFVFDKNYELMPLNEVENFYKTNHHLPNVPTAKDIQKTGNNLGQTDVILLQKIEELTLYVVELKKEVEALKNNKK
jgi:hypothetical protein